MPIVEEVEMDLYCPFSWFDHYKEPGCLEGCLGSLLRLSTTKREIKPMPCMTFQCKLWDRANDNCVFMNLAKRGA